MFDSIHIRRIVTVFLASHTAIILMLLFFVLRCEVSSGNTVAIVASIVLAVAITLYTAYRIIQSIKEKVESCAQRLNKNAIQLDDKSVYLKKRAAELKQWASDMNEQQLHLQQRVDLINRYGNRITELVAEMNNVEDAAQQFQLASQTLSEDSQASQISLTATDNGDEPIQADNN